MRVTWQFLLFRNSVFFVSPINTAQQNKCDKLVIKTKEAFLFSFFFISHQRQWVFRAERASGKWAMWFIYLSSDSSRKCIDSWRRSSSALFIEEEEEEKCLFIRKDCYNSGATCATRRRAPKQVRSEEIEKCGLAKGWGREEGSQYVCRPAQEWLYCLLTVLLPTQICFSFILQRWVWYLPSES